MCTSTISTDNGNGSSRDSAKAWSPHLKFHNDSRGHVTTKITKDATTADFRLLATIHLQDLGRRAVRLHRHLEAADDGDLVFSDDLPEHLGWWRRSSNSG